MFEVSPCSPLFPSHFPLVATLFSGAPLLGVFQGLSVTPSWNLRRRVGDGTTVWGVSQGVKFLSPGSLKSGEVESPPHPSGMLQGSLRPDSEGSLWCLGPDLVGSFPVGVHTQSVCVQ